MEINDGVTEEGVEALISALERAPTIVVPLVREVPAQMRKVRPASGRWSPHEQACHLAIVHRLFFERLELMISQENPKIIGYDPDTDEAPDHLMAMDLDAALDRYVSDRARLVERLRTLALSDWSRKARHSEYSHYSVFIMFRHLALHDFLHGYRIEESLLSP
jgi:hypothetical protein